ncbi:GNAT family N-acetyltransferase [Acidovorax sp. A1169]|uniref:GNAT family N-acetyltransferase n=1 Tax=Acidovorax sp. A1169 TaxID=3059524 RepID=UPI002737EF04|nr:GNAT family N-acetyltransferase [Acidovorax sp. A1169]MDP4077855.1 GNAT family N-acetyltransferase [Acidovorax sp. A1169]
MPAPLRIEQATLADVPAVVTLLQDVAQWLANAGRPLWGAEEVGHERVLRQISAGAYFMVLAGEADGAQLAGVMRFELDDPHYWPEIAPGTSAFVHKLAVRRAWAGQGVSTALLDFARERARALQLSHLRLDCVADRKALRTIYERFGFVLHSEVPKGNWALARYELAVAS